MMESLGLAPQSNVGAKNQNNSLIEREMEMIGLIPKRSNDISDGEGWEEEKQSNHVYEKKAKQTANNSNIFRQRVQAT